MVLLPPAPTSGAVSSAWVAARKPSTPLASAGSNQSASIAVMIPSRPNGVLNQGTPAYG